jgi:hypothetical protein
MINKHCMNRRNLSWSRDGRIVAELTLVCDVECREPYPCLKINGHAYGQPIDCLVWLDSSPKHLGGERWFALCPHTGKRCATLVLPLGKTHFASGRGWGVAYASTRECELHRAYRAIDRQSVETPQGAVQVRPQADARAAADTLDHETHVRGRTA